MTTEEQQRSAPQTAADQLAVTTEDSDRDRAFTRIVVGVFAVVVIAGAAASYLINPYGHFAPQRFATRVPLDRDEKFELLHRANAPELVVIGSSHVKKLDPRCLQTVTGLRTFNYGVDGGALDDLRAIVPIVLEQHPKRILFGIDAGLITTPPSSGIAKPTMWSRHLPEYLDTKLEDRINALASMLWSQTALTDGLRSVRAGKRSRTGRHDENGFLLTTNEDAEKAAGTFDLATRMTTSIERLASIYGRMDESEARLAILRSLLASAKAHGSRVDVYATPIHPELAAALAKNANGLEPLAAARRLAHRLEAEGLATDLTPRLDTLAIDPTGWLDADHVDGRQARRIVETLYDHPGGCAL